MFFLSIKFKKISPDFSLSSIFIFINNKLKNQIFPINISEYFYPNSAVNAEIGAAMINNINLENFDCIINKIK